MPTSPANLLGFALFAVAAAWWAWPSVSAVVQRLRLRQKPAERSTTAAERIALVEELRAICERDCPDAVPHLDSAAHAMLPRSAAKIEGTDGK